MNKTWHLYFLFVSISAFLQAQQNTVATGGNTNGTAGSVSYSVGQIDYLSYNVSTGKISQGVQQPYEIFEIASIENILFESEIDVYPNPTYDGCRLRMTSDSFDEKRYSYSLYDFNGKLLFVSKVFTNDQLISLNNLEASEMYLVLKDDYENKEIKKFKIVKL